MTTQCVQVKVELGHRAVFRKYPTAEGFTHDWTVFVRGPEGCNIQSFVEKVVFNLHESFPKAKRVVKDPPYQVSESGYGGFLMKIDIHFKNKEDPKRITFEYDLFLNLDNSPPINHARMEKLKFQYPTEDFRWKLMNAGGVCVPMPEDDTQTGNQPAEQKPETPPPPPPPAPAKPETPKKHKHERHKEKTPSGGSSSNSAGSNSSSSVGSSSKHKAGKHPPGSAVHLSTTASKEHSASTPSHKDTSHKSHREGSSSGSHKEHSSSNSHKEHKSKDKDTEKSSHKESKSSLGKRTSNTSPLSLEGSKKRKTSSGTSSSSKSKSSSSGSSSHKDGSKHRDKEHGKSKSSHKSSKKADLDSKARDVSVSESVLSPYEHKSKSKSKTDVDSEAGMWGDADEKAKDTTSVMTPYVHKPKMESKPEASGEESLVFEKSDCEAEVMISPSSSISFSSGKAGAASALGTLIAELDSDDDLLSPLPNNPSPGSFFPSLHEKNDGKTSVARPWTMHQPKIPSGKSMPDKSSAQKADSQKSASESHASTPDSQRSSCDTHMSESQKSDATHRSESISQKTDLVTTEAEPHKSAESKSTDSGYRISASSNSGSGKSKKSSSSSSKSKHSKDSKDKTKKDKPPKDKKDSSSSKTETVKDSKPTKIVKAAKTTTEENAQAMDVENEKDSGVNISQAPNGEDLSVLVEMQKKLLSMSNRQRLQEVVNLIEESGMYKISDTSFDFDLCMLDKHTVKRLQMCLQVQM